MITVSGRNTSSNVQPVIWLLSELGLEFERLDIGGAFGGTDTAEYLAKNPMGLIPVLEDGDITLFESQAILRYIAARYGPQFWPEDAGIRAPADQWMEWAKTTVAPNVVYKAFWQLIRTPAAERDHAILEESVTTLKHLMSIAEQQLRQCDWLAGASMTLADITFGTQLYRYYTLPIKRADLPALAAYYQRLSERQAYRDNVMISYEPLRVPGA